MKIVIFENEYESVRFAFEAANLMYFNDELDITVYPSSQVGNYNAIENISVFFIDIDLSSKSKLDGYGLIKHLLSLDHNVLKKVIILTGNNKIQESLEKMDITLPRNQIIIKPTHFEEVAKTILLVTSKNS